MLQTHSVKRWHFTWAILHVKTWMNNVCKGMYCNSYVIITNPIKKTLWSLPLKVWLVLSGWSTHLSKLYTWIGVRDSSALERLMHAEVNKLHPTAADNWHMSTVSDVLVDIDVHPLINYPINQLSSYRGFFSGFDEMQVATFALNASSIIFVMSCAAYGCKDISSNGCGKHFMCNWLLKQAESQHCNGTSLPPNIEWSTLHFITGI